jgi:gas vesicle protein
MVRLAIVTLLIGATIGLAACGDNTAGTATAPATGPSAESERIRENLNAAGQSIKNAATQAASEAGPALERAKEEGRDAVHTLSQKIADRTATAPAPPQ